MKPPYVIAPNVVSVTGDSGTSSVLDGVHFEMVNGLRVRVLDQNALSWWIPSLGLSVSGSGPKASMVMHTIRPTTHVTVPKGWASYTYSGVTISVPRSWTVEHNAGCPPSTASGALLLGLSNVPQNCIDYPVSLGLVVLNHSTPTSTQKGMPIKVNGLPVVVTGSPGPDGYRNWFVPSLSIDITGQGSNAVRILYTLRRS
jgi:hypothetical protein